MQQFSPDRTQGLSTMKQEWLKEGYDQAIHYSLARPYLLAGVEMDEADALDFLICYRGLSLNEALLYLKDLTEQVVQ